MNLGVFSFYCWIVLFDVFVCCEWEGGVEYCVDDIDKGNVEDGGVEEVGVFVDDCVDEEFVCVVVVDGELCCGCVVGGD